MERVEKEQKQAKSSVGQGMSTMQMAQVVGNQAAVVQMMSAEIAWRFRDVCTPHFIRRHLIDGCEGDMLSRGQMDRLRTEFLRGRRPYDLVFDGYMIGAEDSDDTIKIHHLG